MELFVFCNAAERTDVRQLNLTPIKLILLNLRVALVNPKLSSSSLQCCPKPFQRKRNGLALSKLRPFGSTFLAPGLKCPGLCWEGYEPKRIAVCGCG